MGRPIYEYCNNGNCNASILRSHTAMMRWWIRRYDDEGKSLQLRCDGDVTDEYIVSEYYDECLQKVADYTKEHKLVRQVRDTITRLGKCNFSARERAPYNLLCDAVMRKAIGL